MQIFISSPSGILAGEAAYEDSLPRPGDKFMIPASMHSQMSREMVVTDVTWDLLARTKTGHLAVAHPHERRVTVHMKPVAPGKNADYS